MLPYILIGGALITTVTANIISNRKKKRKILEEKERKELQLQKELEILHRKQKLEFEEYLAEINNFNINFKSLRSEIKYISNYDIFLFKSRHNDLFEKVKLFQYKHLLNYNGEIRIFDTFKADFKNISETIKLINESFIEKELINSKGLLSDIEGKSLDNQQRKSVIINEDNNLVIAGAGSGKTTTIAGKVKYLTERLKVNPDDILLISFTRKSADEMSERIQQKMNIKLPVKTFHKLGLDIIAEATLEKPSIFSLSQKEILELIASFLKNARKNNEYSNNLNDFLAYNLKPYKALDDFTSDREHNNYLNEQKLVGYKLIKKNISNGDVITYREKFKSQEEVLIANFLFRNRIEYEYEEKYKYKTASKKFGQYKPDFYLPEYGIYIEHFGINENGKVPSWFKGDVNRTAQQKYTEGIEWKRNEHKFNNTTLVETYSWEQKKGALLGSLKEKLECLNVSFNPMSNEVLWKYIENNTPEDIDVFTRLLSTFLVLFKSNNETIQNLVKKANKDGNSRANIFLNLFKPIFKSYQDQLIDRDEIDFSDMINLATESVKNDRFHSPYKYIIIDEFQDVSQSRHQLINALLNQVPETKLLCVGDDWQSIYRFAGSDIGIFTGFEKYFSASSISGFVRKTNIGYIESTYRFDNKLIDLSSNFILKNPNQLEKSLKSYKQSNNNPVSIHWYNDKERNGSNIAKALDGALSSVYEVEKENNVSVLLLGRYDFERRILENSPLISKEYNKQLNNYNYVFKKAPKLKINFLTVHTSKGLEADYVIILNGNSGTYGFPSEISDDPLLNFLLSKADQFPNGEERRLFYVALTRARKHVHILSSNEYPSKFITEIEVNEKVTSIKCEWCDNGKLIERIGPYGDFYACNNSHYCNYTRKIEAKDYFTKAKNHFKLGDVSSSKVNYLKAIKIDNNFYKAHHNLATIYYKNKSYSEAILHYDNVLEIKSDSYRTYLMRGLSYKKLEEYSKALEDLLLYDKLCPIDKVNNDTYYNLVVCCLKTDNLELAIEKCSKAMSIFPNDCEKYKILKEKLEPIIKKRKEE